VHASTATHINFGTTPLQSPVIWLRIDARNPWSDSENVGIDNIRFSQIASANAGTLDPADIDAALSSAVPEPASVVFWLAGAVLAGTAFARRKAWAAT
jgi:hypothetical protein